MFNALSRQTVLLLEGLGQVKTDHRLGMKPGDYLIGIFALLMLEPDTLNRHQVTRQAKYYPVRPNGNEPEGEGCMGQEEVLRHPGVGIGYLRTYHLHRRSPRHSGKGVLEKWTAFGTVPHPQRYCHT